MRSKFPVLPLIFLASLSLLIPASRAESPLSPSNQADSTAEVSHPDIPGLSGNDSQNESALADAPTPDPDLLPSPDPQAAPASPVTQPLSPVDDLTHPLSVHQKSTLVVHRTFGPPGFVIPAFEAAVAMADPPPRFPPEWCDGGEAFGRLYGSFFVRHVTGNAAELTLSAAFHEDPRYFPEPSGHSVGRRILHAVWFSFYNETDSGHRFFAFNNFAGAAAAGFVTMAYEPAGFNDITHAGQRTTVDFSTYIGRNLISEFSPELGRLARKWHTRVPNNDHPLWWNSNR